MVYDVSIEYVHTRIILEESHEKGMAEELNIGVDIVMANVDPLAQRRRTSLLSKKACGEQSRTFENQCVCDQYVLNERFYSALENFRVHPANVPRLTEEVAAVRRSVVVDNRTQLDAAIVRIMKVQRKLQMEDVVRRSIEMVSAFLVLVVGVQLYRLLGP